MFESELKEATCFCGVVRRLDLHSVSVSNTPDVRLDSSVEFRACSSFGQTYERSTVRKTLDVCVEVEAENSDSSVFHVGYEMRPPFSSQSSLKWDQLVNWARFCVHIGWFGLK